MSDDDLPRFVLSGLSSAVTHPLQQVGFGESASNQQRKQTLNIVAHSATSNAVRASFTNTRKRHQSQWTRLREGRIDSMTALASPCPFAKSERTA